MKQRKEKFFYVLYSWKFVDDYTVLLVKNHSNDCIINNVLLNKKV